MTLQCQFGLNFLRITSSRRLSEDMEIMLTNHSRDQGIVEQPFEGHGLISRRMFTNYRFVRIPKVGQSELPV